MFGECDDVLRTFTQRWHAKLELTETMVEIFAEAAFFDRGFEVLIRSGDDADVDFNFPVTADAVKGLPV